MNVFLNWYPVKIETDDIQLFVTELSDSKTWVSFKPLREEGVILTSFRKRSGTEDTEYVACLGNNKPKEDFSGVNVFEHRQMVNKIILFGFAEYWKRNNAVFSEKFGVVEITKNQPARQILQYLYLFNTLNVKAHYFLQDKKIFWGLILKWGVKRKFIELQDKPANNRNIRIYYPDKQRLILQQIADYELRLTRAGTIHVDSYKKQLEKTFDYLGREQKLIRFKLPCINDVWAEISTRPYGYE